MAKKNGKKKSTDVSAAVIKDAFGRWEKGGTLHGIAAELKKEGKASVSGATVRGWIINHLGGPEKYEAAMAKRAEANPRTAPTRGGAKTTNPEVAAANTKALEQFRSGVKLSDIATALGLGPTSSNAVHARVARAAGVLQGSPEWRALLNERSAHVTVTTRQFTGGSVTIDDSAVPVVMDCRRSDGWHSRVITVHGATENVLIAPDGTEYVQAAGNQRADLITKATRLGGDGLRWRLYENSTQAKKVAKEEKQVEQHARKTAAKKAAKKSNASPTALLP